MSIDPITWAKANEQNSRDLIGAAAQNPGAHPCDDAFTAAACLGVLLDHERVLNGNARAVAQRWLDDYMKQVADTGSTIPWAVGTHPLALVLAALRGEEENLMPESSGV